MSGVRPQAGSGASRPRQNRLKKTQLPDFPKVDFELGWRKITDFKTQNTIMDVLQKLTWHINPKIWVGVDLLRTYTNLRPDDLLRLTEGDIDTEKGVLIIWRPTKRKNKRKTVRLVQEHIEMIIQLKKSWPAMPNVKFFRHSDGRSGVASGEPFGKRYFYKWWKQACARLEIFDLDLYGGTRHTTTTELAKLEGEGAARDASGHETNKAFERYCQMQGERAHQMALIVRRHQTGKVIDFSPKAKAE